MSSLTMNNEQTVSCPSAKVIQPARVLYRVGFAYDPMIASGWQTTTSPLFEGFTFSK
jgi:hypothetical protein